MNFVNNLNIFGNETKEIPCITGTTAPTDTTEGAVGSFYMDISTSDVYKCTSVSEGLYTWVAIESSKLRDAVIKNNFRIGTLEEYLNLDSRFVTVTASDGVIQVPQGAKGWACVLTMGAVTTAYNYTAEHLHPATRAIQLKVNGEVILDCSGAYSGSVDGRWDCINYSNGKWTYQDACYIKANNGEDLENYKEDPEDTVDESMSYSVLFKRATPIKTDVTDLIIGSAFIDCSNVTEIEVVSRYEADANNEHGRVEIMFEI